MNEVCLSCRKHTKCGRAKVETIGCGYYVPMTNEEWIRQASTEQLAEFLADKCNEVVDFVLHEVDENAEDIEPDDYWYRQDAFVEWLKQPHQ